MDGTFKITKEPFQQLWSIHTFVHKGNEMKQIPLVFVLMTNKSTEDYVAVSLCVAFFNFISRIISDAFLIPCSPPCLSFKLRLN